MDRVSFVVSFIVVHFICDGFKDQSVVGSGQNQSTLRVISAEDSQNRHSLNKISDFDSHDDKYEVYRDFLKGLISQLRPSFQRD
jgi:hypothetical protein